MNFHDGFLDDSLNRLFLFDEVFDAGVGAFALDVVEVIEDAAETADSKEYLKVMSKQHS